MNDAKALKTWKHSMSVKVKYRSVSGTAFQENNMSRWKGKWICGVCKVYSGWYSMLLGTLHGHSSREMLHIYRHRGSRGHSSGPTHVYSVYFTAGLCPRDWEPRITRRLFYYINFLLIDYLFALCFFYYLYKRNKQAKRKIIVLLI